MGDHPGRLASKNEIVAIVNPRAGRGRGEQIWRRVRASLGERGIGADTHVTHHSGNAMVLAQQAVEDGYRTVVAVGGDGTVHEIVNGLLDGDGVRDDVRLAVVPAGTGMDFARNLHIRRGARAAADRIATGRERRVDVGVLLGQNRAFVNFMETGLGAAVVAHEAHMGDRWPGRASFLVSALRAAMQEDNIRVRVEIDGHTVFGGRAVSVVVANGPYFGGGMKIAPRARLDDGLLDVLILGDFGRLELAGQIWKVYPGVHVSHPKVVHLRGRSVAVRPLDFSLLDLDGELGGDAQCEITVLPGGLRVLH
jgi:YegS/Rv2252/BmrU family lipid kinase